MYFTYSVASPATPTTDIFADWLLLLSNMFLLHVFPWLDSLFLFSDEWYPIVWMYHSLFVL